MLDASLQVIHNSPWDIIGAFDVYINDTLFLDDIAYQNAAPYLTVPSGVNLDIDIVDFFATDNSAPFFSTTANFAADSVNVGIAQGNPEIPPGPGSFGLAFSNQGRLFATNPANAEFLPFHGGIDVPTFDIVARGGPTLVNNLAFPNYGPFVSVAPANYIFDVKTGDGATNIRSFSANLSGTAGGAFVLAATGWLVPPLGTIGDAQFGLMAVFPDGSAVILPEVAPLVQGTNSNDAFTAQLRSDNPGILQVIRGNQTTQYLTATNPVVNIAGLNGNDSLTVRYTAGRTLPTIGFDGGAGTDTVDARGSSGADLIQFFEVPNLAAIVPAGGIKLVSVNSVNVLAGAGHDVVDARGLTTINTTIDGEAGNDTLYGGSARDSIFGGLGNDRLFGGPGADLLVDFFGQNVFDEGSPPISGFPFFGWFWF